MIQELHYIVDLRRRPTYYVFVLYVPTFIVTLLSLTGLFTPFNNEGERVERVTLGLTTLLSLAVMLTIVGDDMPKSTNLPQLGIYVLAEILLVSIGVLVTIVLLLFHQRIFTRFHPRVPEPILPPPSASPPSYYHSSSYSSKHRHRHRSRRSRSRRLSHYTSSTLTQYSSASSQLLATLHDVLAHLRTMVAKEIFRLKWVKIFDIIDLVCLVIFQCINFILTFCFLFIR
ncbi:hypothetical protein WR25_27312 [Diploscapter pachys]|uniref:Neurotransmitter-gated ion-channel transmembrane domain-containing protein n=1 Tax=Diploscapter pachys TaxID=2018661 RepID=A0A2A2M3Q5_9BILA|nr:hypothetical protein WR25_27312 [Diploscapter pachys]